MAKKGKIFVVWQGWVPGIYTTWEDALSQTHGFKDAKFKGFNTLAEAEFAFARPWKDYVGKQAGGGGAILTPNRKLEFRKQEVNFNSICVDAACSGNPGKMEYRCVRTHNGEELFRSPVFPEGTNNIGEFLALVHALAQYSAKHPEILIYSDSRIAMGWVKQKVCKTKLVPNARNQALLDLIQRGETWLRTHTWKNPIVKWETERWGEIPADFGRK